MAPEPTADKPQRIAKIMARAGLCSRREAERWVEEGRVSVDGKVLTSPAVALSADARITVDGKPLQSAEKTRLWRYHKPAGLVTSTKDAQGRPTVFDKLPAELPRVVTVGRLDLTSEGLLLLTNDGEVKRRLEQPATGWVRRYRVRVYGSVTDDSLATLAKGMTVDGIRYGPIQATLDSERGRNAWLTMGLREGKNREIRRVCEALGWTVSRLIRTAYGPFQLGSLARGAVEEVPARILAQQIGGGGTKGWAKPAKSEGHARRRR
jgi:23S rRNA pseudouridine2605 synthase